MVVTDQPLEPQVLVTGFVLDLVVSRGYFSMRTN